VGARRARTERDARRRAHGQNFLASRSLAAQLVQDARVAPADLVVELGAGTGTLTAEIARRSEQVIAVELDPCGPRVFGGGFAATGASRSSRAICSRFRCRRTPSASSATFHSATPRLSCADYSTIPPPRSCGRTSCSSGRLRAGAPGGRGRHSAPHGPVVALSARPKAPTNGIPPAPGGGRRCVDRRPAVESLVAGGRRGAVRRLRPRALRRNAAPRSRCDAVGEALLRLPRVNRRDAQTSSNSTGAAPGTASAVSRAWSSVVRTISFARAKLSSVVGTGPTVRPRA
jgi:Ribosomal RNA adenine dimethylase